MHINSVISEHLTTCFNLHEHSVVVLVPTKIVLSFAAWESEIASVTARQLLYLGFSQLPVLVF